MHSDAFSFGAVIGLSTGSLACHRHEGEQSTFFEIDPEVVRYFPVLSNFSDLRFGNKAPLSWHREGIRAGTNADE